ncbi:MAG: hypothetical protein AAGH40_14560 [Verrucomicrobiota bacterium]
MKTNTNLFLLVFACLINAIGVCEAQQLDEEEKLQVGEFSKKLDALKELFERRIRTKYDIGSDEDLVFSGYSISSSAIERKHSEDNVTVYTFSYGLKSSLVRYDTESPFGERIAYTHSYLAKIFPQDGTIQLFQIKPKE